MFGSPRERHYDRAFCHHTGIAAQQPRGGFFGCGPGYLCPASKLTFARKLPNCPLTKLAGGEGDVPPDVEKGLADVAGW
jgi:hypothetical protein